MNTIADRKHFIDWIRILAFFLLIFFHCTMPFVIFGWEVKNTETSIGLSRLIYWLHQWRLPLLFFISGVGIHFSLQKRTIPSFAGERVIRLFIPLLFAMFFMTPAQVYIEKLQKGVISGSYLDFYPTVWNLTPYPEGTLTWSHLWFVVYLFVYCLMLIPIFYVFRIKPIQKWKERMVTYINNPFLVMLLAAPFMCYYLTLYLDYPEQQSLLDDWFLFVFSITLVLYGYFLGGSDRFWEICEKYRYFYLSTALCCIIVLFYEFWWHQNLPKTNDYRLYEYGILNSIHIWSLILCFLGFGKKYLNFSNDFLNYTNKAVYPYYILHQTIIVVFGYFVVQWHLPIFSKLIILVFCCFISIFLIHRWFIRPFKLTRILFGLKALDKKQ